MLKQTNKSWLGSGCAKLGVVLALAGAAANVQAQQAQGPPTATMAHVSVDVNGPTKPVSPWLTGACIEDVNHEIYGGIYSQMVFGESFQEPSDAPPVDGFAVVEGEWRLDGSVLWGDGGPGVKCLVDGLTMADGRVGVQVKMPEERGGVAGIIVGVQQPGRGADNFKGYEIALETGGDRAFVVRHDFNATWLGEEKINVPADAWIDLTVAVKGNQLTVFVDGKQVMQVTDPSPLGGGQIGLRNYGRPAFYQNLWVQPVRADKQTLAFKAAPQAQHVSRMWQPIVTGSAKASFALTQDKPFVGQQSQVLAMRSGQGEVGIENQGLNRWGMAFKEGKPYDGVVWARSDEPVELFASFESRDGSQRIAETALQISGGGEWQRVAFTLTPDAAVSRGRFALVLKQPGEVDLGYALLEPGAWGKYKGLPLRKDVVDGLVNQGISVLRYGGSMVDNPRDYRWKNMIGPREQRQPYAGHWYRYSTNGFGIIDFMNLCEAAGFMGMPCFSIDETPQDMVDFLAYANGPVDSPWGQCRAADGHPEPYGLKRIQIGNEESVNEAYWQRLEPIATAIWDQDPSILLIVGDFQYDHVITDVDNVTGSAGGNRDLRTHEKIMALAKSYDAEVWFDTHIWTDGPNLEPSMLAFESLVDAIDELSHGAKHAVVVFEFNANNHRQRRALANATGINRIMRDGRVPVVLSANCLQPDGQNDNGWDQGLLFLNPDQVWLQPPGYVTQMYANAYQPLLVPTSVQGPETVDVATTKNEACDVVVLRLVNRGPSMQPVTLNLAGFVPTQSEATVVSMAAPYQAANTAASPELVVPRTSTWAHRLAKGAVGQTRLDLPPASVTVLTFE